MKDKGKQFLEELGLGNSKALMEAYFETLEGTYSYEEPDIKVLPFFSEHAAKMDFPENSIQVHIENMIVTYGEEKTLAIIKNILVAKGLK